MKTSKKARGVAFAKENLSVLCEEILEWQDTGDLRDGLLRKMAREYLEDSGEYALAVSENIVKTLAMRVVVFDHTAGANRG